MLSNKEDEVVPRILIRLIAICLVISMMPLAIFAEGNSTIEPRYTYANTLDVVIDISNNEAFCATSMQLYDFNKCRVFCRLQQQQNGNWVTLNSWYSNEAVYYVYSSRRIAVEPGYRYRFSVFGYVYDNNGNLIETITNEDQFTN